MFNFISPSSIDIDAYVTEIKVSQDNLQDIPAMHSSISYSILFCYSLAHLIPLHFFKSLVKTTILVL